MGEERCAADRGSGIAIASAAFAAALTLRVVARFGFAIAKPVSRNAPGGGFRFAVLNQA